jgi:hypothetical protein
MTMLIAATLAAFLGLPIIGAVLGGLQLVYYRFRVRAGKMKEEDIPFFGALLLRSMVFLIVLVIVGAIIANINAGPDGQDQVQNPEPSVPPPH